MYNSKTIRKGLFKPKNPRKYSGDANNIVYRSNLERRFFKILDENPDIIAWGSEELVIPYKSPIDGKIHRYFTDLIIKTVNKQVFVIEIKPYAYTMEPKPGNKSKKTLLTEMINWKINEAKWNHAKIYCEKRGWTFKVVTERELGKAK